jgi:RNA polymerase sigma factor (sigma-70 family)
MDARERINELVPRLRRYARALTVTTAEADALMRGTLERAAARLRIEPGDRDLRVWLFALMHEAYMQSAFVGDAEGDTQPRRAAPRPATFQDAMASLAPVHREVFLLVTLEDLTYEEVTRALNVPIGTVMSRLSRAREKLRLALIGEARLRMVTKR